MPIEIFVGCRSMKRLYILKKGVLKREGNTLCIYSKEGKRFIPVKNVSSIYVFSEVTFNKRLLEFLTKNGIVLHLFNYFGYYIGTYYPRIYNASGFMILKQVEHYLDMDRRLALARLFVYGSISNMLSILGYYKRKGRDLDREIELIRDYQKRVWDTYDLNELRGLEGNSRRIYYLSWNKIITREGFSYTFRSKRPPLNRLNALISFGNSLLYTAVLGEIYKTHLDPRIGYLHETNFRRFSLNLDIAEIFKPIIVDRIIFNLVNRRILTEDDFSKQAKGIFLKDRGRRRFVEAFEKRLQESINMGRRKVKYERVIRMELYKLEKHLIGDKEYSPYMFKI